MKKSPLQNHILSDSNITISLRELWKEAFGDTDAFLDAFASTAFHPDRCRFICIDETIAAALYWFDCSFQGRPVAYIYAVATKKAYRGQGLCHKLMEDTHRHLRSLGYAGAFLVPGSDNLFQFYQKMGYQICTYINELSENSAENDIIEFSIHPIGKDEFARLRHRFLPEMGIIQENENLDFLETQAQFFAGDDFLLAASINAHTLYGLELLGNTSRMTEILQALSCSHGTFRTPGNEKPFGMYYPLDASTDLPRYFGFAFD